MSWRVLHRLYRHLRLSIQNLRGAGLQYVLDMTLIPSCAHGNLKKKKLFVVVTGLLLNFNTTLASSLPSGAINSLDKAFNVSSRQQVSLPVSIFLVGYIFGPILFGPVSESFGRRFCFLSSFALYTLFNLACALAPNWPALLLFRFFVGVGASAPQAVLGGMYSDLYPNLVHRGRAVMILGLMSNIGPLVGPIIAGYSSTTNWQWMFWITLIMAGATWPLLLLLPGEFNDIKEYPVTNLLDLETFLPVIIRRHAVGKPSVNKNSLNISHVKAKDKTAKALMVVILTRPIRMFAEPLVLFTDLFLLYQYSILFLYFEAYPIIFQGRSLPMRLDTRQ